MEVEAAEDPLSQPTRARLFARLVDLRRAASTEELAAELGLHVNGVRRHLERLAAAGLVERRRARHGRGRPRDEWAPAAAAEPGGRPPRRYADLARWLARAIPDDAGRAARAERAGRRIGRELAPEGEAPPARALRDALSALGFRPVLERAPGGAVRCRLDNCPYMESAREDPDLVCELHRGITEGLVETLAPGARLVRWEPHDPEAAGCVAEVEGGGFALEEPEPASGGA